MLYFLDANVLIDANRDYYPIKQVPEFWEWLQHCSKNGRTKIAREIYEEIMIGKPDNLTDWLKENRSLIVFDGDVDSASVSEVLTRYGSDLDDEQSLRLGRDPVLIAYALQNPPQRSIVTTEVSKPSR